MSKNLLRVVSIAVAVLGFFPPYAHAAPNQSYGNDTMIHPIDDTYLITSTPLGDKQIEYPVHTHGTGSFPGRIVSVATRATRSGNTVYPNLEVYVMGTSYVTASVELQKLENGYWMPIVTYFNGQLIDKIYRYSPGFPAEAYSTYRFTFLITSNGGGGDDYYMVGNPFTL